MNLLYKYPGLIAMALASKFFMLLSVGFLISTFAVEAMYLPAMIAGMMWGITLAMTFYLGFKNWKEVINDTTTK